jgi:hypothetical protein
MDDIAQVTLKIAIGKIGEEAQRAQVEGYHLSINEIRKGGDCERSWKETCTDIIGCILRFTSMHTHAHTHAHTHTNSQPTYRRDVVLEEA